MPMSVANWQILDVGSIWMREFASALAARVPVVAWQPEMSRVGALQDWERTETIADPPLEVIRFPLQRGYARWPLDKLLHFENAVLRRLGRHCEIPAHSALICSTPFYAPVAERWKGPTVYYVTDRTASYEGMNAEQVRRLDRKMCAVAKAICPNSSRLAEYLIQDAGCPPNKITIVPNATRKSNLSPEPLLVPGALPADMADLPRPIVGVIGNLAGNMDWELLQSAISTAEGFSWAFVGPTSMPIADSRQANARSQVFQMARFVGPKSYGELQEYARSFDVAVLPYLRREPTYSGSSTRFYEHLAACRPMIATRGFAELSEKQPLVELVDSAAEMASALTRLREIGFHDGYEELRWNASRVGTWEERAAALRGALEGAGISA